MVKQYPYSLYELKVIDSVYDENTGGYTEAKEEWVFVSKCRDEANGGGGKIVTADGETYVFGATVYMPKSTTNVLLNAMIKVEDESGSIRLQGQNKLFKPEQLHSRLWV